MTTREDNRIATILAPLSLDVPPAAACRDEPAFSALEAEIRKLERAGPSAVDWRSIVVQGEQFLATRSKDLAVAVWLARRWPIPKGCVALRLAWWSYVAW